MKKMVMFVVAALILSSAYAEGFNQSAYQFSGGFTNISITNKTNGIKDTQNGFNGLSLGIAKQYGLVDHFSTSTGLDFAYAQKSFYGVKFDVSTIGINQTFYYNFDQGNFVIRPLVEFGLGSRTIGFSAGLGDATLRIDKSSFYYKYNLGGEIVFNNGFGAQLKYGQQFTNFKMGGHEFDQRDGALTLSGVYRF